MLNSLGMLFRLILMEVSQGSVEQKLKFRYQNQTAWDQMLATWLAGFSNLERLFNLHGSVSLSVKSGDNVSLSSLL